MPRSTVAVLCAALLAVSAPPAHAEVLRDADSALVQTLTGSASSPEEHRALVRHHRARAARAREKAASHRWMAEHYGGSLRPAIAAEQRQHCARLARSYEGQARNFDRLAEAHEQAAAAPSSPKNATGQRDPR